MKTRSENFIFGEELVWEEVGGGLKRQIMSYDGQLMIVKVQFEKGSIGYVHEHFHTQGTYVVSGQFEVTIDGVTKLLKAGDAFYVQPDAPHGAVCVEEGILIDTFSPVRLDFLKK